MDQPLNNVDLRPLGIGEIFDRAVTLLVRNAAPFLVVAFCCVTPGVLLQTYAALTLNPLASSFATIVSGLGGSVATMATALMVSQLYAKAAPDWRGALLRGLAGIPRALGMGFLLVFLAIIPLAVTAGPAIALARAGAAGLLIAIPFALACLAVIAAALLAQLLALNAIAVEGAGATRALGRGLSAVFAGPQLARTAGMAVALILLSIGGSLTVGFFAGFLQAALKSVLAAQVVEVVLLAVLSAFTDVGAAVYYFDMRIRRDGYDLEQSLDALEGAPV